MSTAIALVLLVLAAKALFVYSSPSSYPHILFVWANRFIGYPDMYFFTATALFIIFLRIYWQRETKARYQRYLTQLIKSVRQIAEGDFEHKVPIYYLGELGQHAGNINRIVERLQAAMQEERNAQQQQNELITNVSHDLRTPLTSIIGYLGLIEQDRSRDEVELRYYVNVAYEESLRLHQLIQDLFDFTRLRNKGIHLQMRPVNLVELLRQMMMHIQLQLDEAKIELRMEFVQTQLMVMADGNKLRRVFDNLISNAIQYGQEGGVLDIIGRRDQEYIVVEIINYGEMIAGDDLPRLFDRFYRAEKSRAKQKGGSGIGLAIVKQIIDLHHGSIHITSDAEQTVVTIRLKEMLYA
ncbi:Alkaline phosphatase synthesis sensor protein PhoR [compost metagenome]